MFRFTVVAIGRVRDVHITNLCDMFSKRLRRYANLKIVEIRESAQADTMGAIVCDGQKLLSAVESNSYLIALTRTGVQRSSVELCNWFEKLAHTGKSHLTFAIGGPGGLSDEVLAASAAQLSMSKMTFTHDMARLIVLEQLYRAMTIWRGEPYHRRGR